VVVLGPSAYNEALVADSGGAAAVDGAYLTQSSTLFLGEDASTVPAVSKFLTWVHKVDPGFKPDFFTLYGWTSAELFVRALASAGPSPTRGSVLRALHAITSFNADGLIVTTDPATKSSKSCYLMARVENGTFRRVDDPPISAGGFICNGEVYFPTK
jgi:hypothetical protein